MRKEFLDTLESREGDSALGGIGEVSESNRVVNDYGGFGGNGFGNGKGEFPKWDGDRRFSDIGNVGIHGWRIEEGGPEPGNSGLEDANSERGWGNTGENCLFNVGERNNRGHNVLSL